LVSKRFCKKSRQPVKSIPRKLVSPIRVPETQSALHPLAQRNAFRRRDARPQRKLFAPRNPELQPNLKSAPVTVKTIEANKRIVIEWLGYSGLTTVEWIFASQKDGTTFVSITEGSIGSSGSQASIMMA
jgi:hypothetical protein